MNIKSFLKLVEIQTKVASMLPFLIGTAFAWYRYGQLHELNVLFMFISLLFIDMTTTAINNYMDHKRAIKREGYGYEEHNGIVQFGLKDSTVIITILICFLIAAVSGFMLFLGTDLMVLLLGMLSFGVGILYSYGPLPISRTPFGEIFSGLFMGFVITFLAVYINVFEKGLIILQISHWNLTLALDLKELLLIFVVSIPMIFGISNIMLANNICDVADDLVNKRYTLPYYIGNKRALAVFRGSYYIGYCSILMLMVFRALPLTGLIVLITWFPLNTLIRGFYKKQIKNETFVNSVKGFVMMNSIYLISILLGIGIQFIID